MHPSNSVPDSLEHREEVWKIQKQKAITMSQNSEQWKTSTKRETLAGLDYELKRLESDAPASKAENLKANLNGFRRLFSSFLETKPTIDFSKIQPLPENAILPYSKIEAHDLSHELIAERLKKLVVVKLNGGLGTSMGCKGPKSVISVQNDLTFLDLTLQQIQHLNSTYHADVPLVLMDSYNTDDETKKVLRKYKNVRVGVHSFCQSKYPRIYKESLMPVPQSENDDDIEGWYPPGHGDFYQSFANCGLLDKFLNENKEICFISNIDNSGATADIGILNFMLGEAKNQPEFVMEVTDKTRADVKGGTLIQYENKLTLLEIAQVPKDYVDEFKSVSKFRIFNTNNIWIKLSAIKRLITTNSLSMDVIVNPKHIDGIGDVIQLETAVGAAIKNFKVACGINVPRSRFLPVKKTSDLLLLMSNLYEIDNGRLTLSPLRSFSTTPLVKLGNTFDKVNDFLARFQGIPDLLELDHLTVSGDVWFGKHVTLKGTVIIITNCDERIDIAPGTILENKIVTGNLRILDH